MTNLDHIRRLVEEIEEKSSEAVESVEFYDSGVHVPVECYEILKFDLPQLLSLVRGIEPCLKTIEKYEKILSKKLEDGVYDTIDAEMQLAFYECLRGFYQDTPNDDEQ